MSLLRIYRSSQTEKFEEQKVISSLKTVSPHVEGVKIETCFYILLKEGEDIIEKSSKRTSGSDKDITEKFARILGDSWEKSFGLSEESKFVPSSKNELLFEIGPRLNYSTPWSTNCVSICCAAGLEEVSRLEKSTRYLVQLKLAETDKEKIIASLYDPMTQQVYDKPLEEFDSHKIPESWTSVDVIERGKQALQDVNSTMGLAFDDWDINYYTQMFREVVRRNPTTVELFDLAQSNSEHSRHWFFKGDYELDGKKLPYSLLDMVMATNNPDYTNLNNVIKFSDNSSGIVGWSIPVLYSSDPKQLSQYEISESIRHIIFTAETHNFPTGVSPFSGATTGTGGRIRDVQAAGRGGHVIAGTAGYCFGNLHIPDYEMEWERRTKFYPSNFATPLEVVIEASNGASDYGNKFGEPVICGFSRSCGLLLDSSTERREYIKPIMFSGGLGSIDETMVLKEKPQKSQLVVKIGGPVYRIGVGGGAASSVQVQGDNAAARDLGAVQRGDAEMEQKLNRVIRSCLELKENPILSIHDQGAGGNANVLKEIMEGAGGKIFTKAFTLGDQTLSTLEIWGAEYQESNALLVNPSQYEDIKRICERERCPIDKVGVITSDHKIRLIEKPFEVEESDTEFDDLPVNLDLDLVLGKMPKKVFKFTEKGRVVFPLLILPEETPMMALQNVLKLPSVASKRYLTNKVDRSVSGLIAQQQCVGPFHTPVADVAVTALSYFTQQGAATSIGEQPIKMLLNPKAGARMTVLEALTNLSSCLITSIEDIKCSANWMWPAKLTGEGFKLYEACEAMCDIMVRIGVAVDGGKDSLSMAARLPPTTDGEESQIVKAPGSLVISAYAPCPDITKVVTPDLKSGRRLKAGALILIQPAIKEQRVGGSALAQVYQQIGSICPDLNNAQIEKFISSYMTIQHLIRENLLLSIHDISDGGLITCLLEMAISGWTGFDIKIPKSHYSSPSVFTGLFNEEVGWVLEVCEHHVKKVQRIFYNGGVIDEFLVIGFTNTAGSDSMIRFFEHEATQPVISLTVQEAALLWEETSYQIEKLQMNPELAEMEHLSWKSRTLKDYLVPFEWRERLLGPDLQSPYVPKVAVIREEGTNGDREMVAAFIQAGFFVYDVTMSDLAINAKKFEEFRGVVFPGGFSYADVLGSAVGWAASINEKEHIKEALDRWRNEETSFSLGVCNGCQLMSLLGWIGIDKKCGIPSVKLVQNMSGRFESRWSRVKINESNSVLLSGMEGAELGIWVAHGEGRFIYESNEVETTLKNKNCVAMAYVDDDGIATENYPFNPNGSSGGVAGLTSECGRHLALMPHPERCVLSWQWPLLSPFKPWKSIAAPWARIFQNAFDWCIKTKK